MKRSPPTAGVVAMWCTLPSLIPALFLPLAACIHPSWATHDRLMAACGGGLFAILSILTYRKEVQRFRNQSMNKISNHDLLRFAARAAAIDPRKAYGLLWNPLADDGAAMRLAIKLHLLSKIAELLERHTTPEERAADPCAAFRRAIVCEAAEIGRGMEPLADEDKAWRSVALQRRAPYRGPFFLESSREFCSPGYVGISSPEHPFIAQAVVEMEGGNFAERGDRLMATARMLCASSEMFELLSDSRGTVDDDWANRRDAVLSKILGSTDD